MTSDFVVMRVRVLVLVAALGLEITSSYGGGGSRKDWLREPVYGVDGGPYRGGGLCTCTGGGGNLAGILKRVGLEGAGERGRV